jgi:hypothetical protein
MLRRAPLAALSSLSLLISCHHDQPKPSSSGDAGVDAAFVGTTVTIENQTTEGTTVYIAFGSKSIITPMAPNWEFCQPEKSQPLVCDFTLAPASIQTLPFASMYANFTVSFGAAVTCGSSLAEVNINQTNPAWYNTADISLVNGFNAKLAIEYVTASGERKMLGPVEKERGNEKAFGVFPLACDVCVSRSAPPCGYKHGWSPECKKGTQFKPDVICQYQGQAMSGAGEEVKVLYLGMAPSEVLHLGVPE